MTQTQKKEIGKFVIFIIVGMVIYGVTRHMTITHFLLGGASFWGLVTGIIWIIYAFFAQMNPFDFSQPFRIRNVFAMVLGYRFLNIFFH